MFQKETCETIRMRLCTAVFICFYWSLNCFRPVELFLNNFIFTTPKELLFEKSPIIPSCFLQGYQYTRNFIATQYPLPHTVNDFWRMVHEQKSAVIVAIATNEELVCLSLILLTHERKRVWQSFLPRPYEKLKFVPFISSEIDCFDSIIFVS